MRMDKGGDVGLWQGVCTFCEPAWSAEGVAEAGVELFASWFPETSYPVQLLLD